MSNTSTHGNNNGSKGARNMKEHLLIALLFVSVPCALAQKAKPKVSVIPGRDTIANDTLAVPNLSQLTPDKLVAIKLETSDCVLTESRLTRVDLVAAYKVRDAVEMEIGNRVAALVAKQTGGTTTSEITARRWQSCSLRRPSKNKGLVADYNNLVDKYNGLLDTYRSNINDNMAFADQMKRILDAQASQCGTAIRDAMESYTPPLHRRINRWCPPIALRTRFPTPSLEIGRTWTVTERRSCGSIHNSGISQSYNSQHYDSRNESGSESARPLRGIADRKPQAEGDP
jgi:hypothetical protein